MWAISNRSMSAVRSDIAPVVGKFHLGLAVQPGHRQPFVDEPVAIARPHPESVTGLVADGFFGQTKHQLPHVFCRPRLAERGVADQAGDQWVASSSTLCRGPAAGRGGSAVPDGASVPPRPARRCAVSACATSLSHPAAASS